MKKVEAFKSPMSFRKALKTSEQDFQNRDQKYGRTIKTIHTFGCTNKK